MTQKCLPSLALLATLILASGCEPFEQASASIGESVRGLGSAVSGMFDSGTESDDPLYQCRTAGHASGTPAYDTCVGEKVAAHCKRYGAASSKPYQDCVGYYRNLDMVRRQTRIYGYTR